MGNEPKKDSDVAAVLDELAAEGHEVQGRDKKPDAGAGAGSDAGAGAGGGDNKGGTDGDGKKTDAGAGADAEAKAAADKAKADADAAAAAEAAAGGNDGEGRTPRKVKMIKAWEHEVAIKNLTKTHEQELEKLRTSLTQGKEDKGAGAGNAAGAIDANSEVVKKLAEKWKAEPEFIADILGALPRGTTELPKDVVDSIARLKTLETQINESNEAKAFEGEFTKDVLPLITAEYPDLPADKLKEIKQRVNDIAFTEDYARTPLQVIYKGLDEFRGIEKPARATGERGQGGTRNAGKTASEYTEADFDGMTEEIAATLPDDVFDRFVAHKRKKAAK